MLTIDIGNTSIKWAIWQDGQPILAETDTYHKVSITQAFDSIFSGAPQQDSVWVACVASQDIEKALVGWMQQYWSIEPVFLGSKSEFGGVLNAYPEPAELGVDRWAALLGARSLHKSPVCVIDIGTAVTVDLMDAEGIHRGGRIMPGVDMMRASLLHNTVGVNAVEGDCPGFALNTADAVSSGTMHMLAAGLLEVYESARSRMGNGVKLIVTGGKAEEVMHFLKDVEVFHEPHIVLHGLHYASQQ
jgi:type III pantothenate kinase